MTSTKKPAFNEEFNSFVCEGDTIETKINGILYTARIEHDQNSQIDDDDCHNIDQAVTGCNDEQQEKLIAAREGWFNNDWFYCGVVISASKEGIEIDNNAASLWSIEANYPGSDNTHLHEIVSDLIEEAIDNVQDQLAEMIHTLQG